MDAEGVIYMGFCSVTTAAVSGLKVELVRIWMQKE